MPTHTPAEVHELFSQYFSTGDINALVSLYEPTAVMFPQPGIEVCGIPAIKETLLGFLAMKGNFNMTSGKVVSTTDVAILFSDWNFDAIAPDGSSIRLTGQTSDVVRRQQDGNWLIIIDCPFGAAGIGV
jgi:ketosteroid isomerase-like protein